MEGPLHAALKTWYSRSGDSLEVPVDGFVIDLVRGDLLIEIQTGGFSSMKRKVTSLLDGGHRLLIVHPIAQRRTIVKIGEGGEVVSRRRSPKRGHPLDVFSQLVSFPELLMNPLLEVEVVTTVEEEYRQQTSHRSWRRHGWSVVERHLVDVIETHRLDGSTLGQVLPADLPDQFTTAHLAHHLDRPRRIAQQMAFCLRATGTIVTAGKTGNAIIYRRGP